MAVVTSSIGLRSQKIRRDGVTADHNKVDDFANEVLMPHLG